MPPKKAKKPKKAKAKAAKRTAVTDELVASVLSDAAAAAAAAAAEGADAAPTLGAAAAAAAAAAEGADDAAPTLGATIAAELRAVADSVVVPEGSESIFLPTHAHCAGARSGSIPASAHDDFAGVRRCWAILRCTFARADDATAYGAAIEPPATHLALYDFLLARGELFDGGFPYDEKKWRWLAHLIQVHYGDGRRIELRHRHEQPHGAAQLHAAAAEGDAGQIAALLDAAQPSLVDSASPHIGTTALLLAVENDHVDATVALLRRGAFADAPGFDGMTAVLWAARNGAEDMVRLLLCCGATGAAETNVGETAAFFAAKAGNDKLLRLLVAGASAEDALVRPVKTIGGGCDAGAVTAGGWSLAHAAAASGNVSTLKAVAALGVPLAGAPTTNGRGRTGPLPAEVARRLGGAGDPLVKYIGTWKPKAGRSASPKKKKKPGT